MKGIVFVLIKKAIQRNHGEPAVERMLATEGLDERFGKGEDYPDADLHQLLDAAEPFLPGSGPEVRRWLGRRVIGEMKIRYVFDVHDSVEHFLRRLDTWVHPEVEKLFPDARFPDFEVEEADGAGRADLDIVYRSPRELCYFAEGLIEGTADRYDQRVALEQVECTHRGDPHCRILLTVRD